MITGKYGAVVGWETRFCFKALSEFSGYGVFPSQSQRLIFP
jgi:hypothetical protein